MKKQSTFSVWAILLVFAVSGCFSPWKENTAQFTLVLGDNSGASRAAGQGHSHPDPAVLDELEHSVVLSNGAETVTLFAAKGQKSIEAVVAAGKWDIAVTTFRDNDLYATGSTTANLQPGQNNVVSITMTMTWITVPGDTLGEKISWLSDIPVTGGKYLVNLTSDSIGEEINDWMLSCPGEEKNITIKIVGIGEECWILFPSTSSGSLFTVGNGVKLILENITLSGSNPNNSAPLVTVSAGGTLEMLSGSAITGNTNRTNNGGGVSVYGTFIMHGGEISGNHVSVNGGSANIALGGGVYVADGGTFTMNGGTINGNTSGSSGGGVSVYGNFIMNGGEIFGNETIGGEGGGVYLSAGTTFYMTGGTIYGSNAEELSNTAPIITPSRGAALCSSGTAQAQYGTFTTPGNITTWVEAGELLGAIDDTIKVVNGDRQ